MADHLSFLGPVLFICFIAESSCKPTCGKEFYLDAATGNCDPCSDICEHVAVQNTFNLCNDKCPGYLEAVNGGPCLTTQYYDDVVGRCEECDVLCRHAQRTGRQEQCNRHCPKWTTATVYGTGAVTVASSNVNGSTEPESHASVDKNIPLIVLGSIAGVVTVSILVIVALKRRRITYRLTKAKCTKSGTQERGQAQEEMQRLSVPETERPPPSAPVIDT